MPTIDDCQDNSMRKASNLANEVDVTRMKKLSAEESDLKQKLYKITHEVRNLEKAYVTQVLGQLISTISQRDIVIILDRTKQYIKDLSGQESKDSI